MPDDFCEDWPLVWATLQGEEEAFRSLVERNIVAVQRQMRHFSLDVLVIEELTQSVFTEAYLNLATFRGEVPFGHWLARIGTLLGYAHWREKKRHRRELPLDEARDRPAAQHPAGSPEQAAELLFAILQELSDDDRLLLTLHYLDGCGQEEIANRLGLTRVSVAVRIHRAKKRLRKIGRQAPWNDKLMQVMY